MRAAPGRAVAPRAIAQKSRRVDIASTLVTYRALAPKVAEQGEFRVNRHMGPPAL